MTNKQTIGKGMAIHTHEHAGVQTLFMDMAAATGSAPASKPFKSAIPDHRQYFQPWAPWGEDNLFPQRAVADIETCGILNSIIDGKARFALCEGMIPARVKRTATGREIVDVVQDPEITEFMEMNNLFDQTFGWLKDQIALSNGLGRFMLRNDRKKITRLMRHDFTEVRVQKEDAAGVIDNVYLSAQWQNVRGKADFGTHKTAKGFTVPLLNPHNPLEDLRERKTGNEFAMLFRYPGWNKHYYSTPMWYAAHKWVKIAQGVPSMKSAMFENAMVLKYMVIIHEGYWTKAHGDDWDDLPEDQQAELRGKLYDEIDRCLVGSHNAHKSIFVNGYRDAHGNTWQDIEIKKIEGQTAQGELLPDAATANAEIAFALLFNPAIIGATMPSGPYTNSQGGNNVEQAVLLQIILHELERRNISRLMNVVKYYNGWDKQYPDLDFIIPATTLGNFGGSKQPSPQKPPQNANQNN